MSIPARTLSPEAVDEARRLYEHSRVPLTRIAEGLGISRSTLNQYRRRWGWVPRGQRIPEGEAPTPPPDTRANRRALIARLAARVEREIAAVEQLIAAAGLQPGAGNDAERAARTLAVLVRTLRELAALERAEPPSEDEEEPRDADTYRRELAATLDRLLAGGAAQ
ncbi:MAG TPA: hypothetical protein VLA00_17755 [Xanthobacteraceae bacterium]|nr:hypothetical protein [Xanthobacteraceae bacterium]